MNALLQKIDIAKVFEVAAHQFEESLLIEDTVPASSQKPGSVQVSSFGHFILMFVTGRYATTSTAGVPADDGICHLRGRLIDALSNRPLFNDYIPFDLWMTPGRVKTLAASGAASNTLFYPIPIEYPFAANGIITLDVKNDSDVAQSYSVMLHGVRVLAVDSVQGIHSPTRR